MKLGRLAVIAWLGGAVWAQSAGFDAVSIKPSEVGTRGSHIRADPGRLAMANVALQQIILIAYELKPYQLQGPTWLNEEHFDIVATTGGGTPAGHIMTLLQPVLQQRFGLTMHRETRQMALLALMVGRSGLKNMKAGADDNRIDSDSNASGVHLIANCSMSQLADYLARQTGRVVLDQTGLAGAYAFSLDFTPQRQAEAQAEAGAAPGASPTLFTALPEQLGLRLEPKKGPVEIWVVDHASKVPTGN